MALRFIDVSIHQGTIDFVKVKAAGYRGVYAKATEGGSYVDPKAATNLAGARTAGLDVGGYHYGHPGSAYTPEQQADYFLSKLGDTRKVGTYPPALDIETRCWNGVGAKPPYAASNCGHMTQSNAAVQGWIKRFNLQVRRKTGRDCVVYTYTSFLKDVLGGWGKYPGSWLWLADYAGDVDDKRALAQQYTSSGAVPGISGRVDLDTFLGSEVTYQLFRAAGVVGASKRIQAETSAIIARGTADIDSHRGLYM